MWNAEGRTATGTFLSYIPGDLAGLLQEISETHLVQLAANARGWQEKDKKFSMTVQDCAYHKLPVSRYRVYCLEILREQFSQLGDDAQFDLKHLLPFDSAAILWQEDVPAESGYDTAREAPFNKAINVFDGGVPG